MDYWETRLSDSTRKISCQLATVHVLAVSSHGLGALSEIGRPRTYFSGKSSMGRKFLADWRMRETCHSGVGVICQFSVLRPMDGLRLAADSIQEKRSTVHRYRRSFPSSQTDYLSDYQGYACFDQRVFSVSTGGGELRLAP
ncbi:hypothetical protein An13g00470 [Aspergillus niger]|uniref:Uncharacterized protein n=2 Tax=Aspergillus niger TaxID=5061 RepID=A2R198_ASPNC|nr:hypothetical protein An13g00470 [Aspergillus niger]CAK41448.1 hypothetical protein An13g00470 [Aspergillus niger]